MEAMWTRFQPAIVAARSWSRTAAIGEVRQVQADLGVDRPYDPTDRLFDPAQGGGAMLDLGVYVVSLAQHFLGDPTRWGQRLAGSDRGGCGGRVAARLRRRSCGQSADLTARSHAPGRRGSTAPVGGSTSRRASTIPSGSCLGRAG